MLFDAQNKPVLEEGIAGVLTYYIPHINSTLAVMFNLPIKTSFWFRNLWNVQLYSGKTGADCRKYVYGFIFPIRAGHETGRELLDSGLRFDGIMTANPAEAFLNFEVHPVKQT